MYAEVKIIKLKKCNWCGSEFIKKHNRQMYCSDYCQKHSRAEKNRSYFRKYYHKNKKIMADKQKCGLGSGYLSMHRNKDFNQEFIAIRKEMKRLKIK